MYTYDEAQKIADERNAADDAWHKACGEPHAYEGDVWTKYITERPDGLTNFNVVRRLVDGKPSFMATSGRRKDGRVFEYPCNILAWGGPIPEEAYVSDTDLQSPIWTVLSSVEDYSQW